MSTAFPPEFENYVQQAVAAGHYSSTEAAVREALRLLQRRDHNFQELKKDVVAGFEQLDQGESIEYDDAALNALFNEIERTHSEKPTA